MLPGYYSQEHPDEVQEHVYLYDSVLLSFSSGQYLHRQSLT